MPSLRHFTAAVFVAVCSLPADGEMRVIADAPLTGPDRYPIAVAVDPIVRKAFVTVGGPRQPVVVVVDLDTVAAHDIALPEYPSALIADAAAHRVHLLYADPDTYGGGGSRLAVIDATSETVVAEVALEGFPHVMAADFGRREIYVAGAWSDVTTLDVDTHRAKSRIPLALHPAGIAVDRARQRLFIGHGDDFVAGTPSVATIDLHAGTVSMQPLAVDESDVALGAAWPVVDERSGVVHVQHDDGRLAILRPPWYEPVRGDASTDYVKRPDGASLSVVSGTLYQVAYPTIRCARDRTCPLPEPGAPTLRAVDGATGRAATTTLPAVTGFGRGTVIVDDDGGDVYAVLGAPARAVLRIDPATLDVRETLASPDFDAYVAFRDPVTQRLFLLGTNRIQAIETRGAMAGTRIAHGYRHEAFDHYFVSADPVESRLIGDGRHGSDWVPGEDLFRVWTEPVAGSVPVCRFFSARFAPKSSHVFAPHAAECEALKHGGAWQYEGIAFHVALPDASGACPTGTEPLYRLYNGGAGGAPNHRYTPSPQVVAAMAVQGWSAEGIGPERVFACTPALH